MIDKLVLSIFPGIDMLGRAFDEEGYCVVRGPDTIWGGDVRSFSPPLGRFDGVIGGPPCQDFSSARRCPATGYGVEMLQEFARVVTEASPRWFLLENVPSVPDIAVSGYSVQRFDLNSRECGMKQRRLRHFQFGHVDGFIVVPERISPIGKPEPTCLASEGGIKSRRGWADFCELQGLPRSFSLRGMSKTERYRAVGNGVPIPMGRVVARAVLGAHKLGKHERMCVCNCGRLVSGKKKAALSACRKRMERRRKATGLFVTVPGTLAERGHVTELVV